MTIPMKEWMSRGGLDPSTSSMRPWLLVLPGTLATVMALAVGKPMSDWDAAITGGRYLLNGHLSVFADMPHVQMGPLALLLAGLLQGRVYLVAVCALLPLVLWIITLPYPPTRALYIRALAGGMLLAWLPSRCRATVTTRLSCSVSSLWSRH